MNPKLDILNEIKTVDAPSFLFNKISQRIENGKKMKVSPKLAYTVSLAFAVLLAINMTFVFKYSMQKPNGSDLIGSMHLIEDHSLYK